MTRVAPENISGRAALLTLSALGAVMNSLTLTGCRLETSDRETRSGSVFGIVSTPVHKMHLPPKTAPWAVPGPCFMGIFFSSSVGPSGHVYSSSLSSTAPVLLHRSDEHC